MKRADQIEIGPIAGALMPFAHERLVAEAEAHRDANAADLREKLRQSLIMHGIENPDELLVTQRESDHMGDALRYAQMQPKPKETSKMRRFFSDLFDDAESLVRRAVLLLVWAALGYLVCLTIAMLAQGQAVLVDPSAALDPHRWPWGLKVMWAAWEGAAIGYIIRNEI